MKYMAHIIEEIYDHSLGTSKHTDVFIFADTLDELWEQIEEHGYSQDDVVGIYRLELIEGEDRLPESI